MSNEPLPSVEEFQRFFLDEYEQYSQEIERTDEVPAELLKRVADIGAYRLTIPKELGGWDLALPDYLPYVEAAAMGPGSGRMLVHLANGIWRPLAWYGSPAQRELARKSGTGEICVAFALTERTGGTGRDLHTRAVRDGDAWRLSGEKHLVTWGPRADVFIISAMTGERRASDALTTFLVPKDANGLQIDPTQRTMGLFGSGHAYLDFENMIVPDSDRLGEIGQGLEVALSFLDYSRISLSMCMVGLAQRALDEAVAFARRRTTFGKAIVERDVIRAQLADMQVDVRAARALVREIGALPVSSPNYRAAACTAKLHGLRMVGRVTDTALKVHGGFGYTKDAVIERIYRDARGFWFEEGTQEIQQLVISRALLGES
jgi:alkylation response protein AidB-like acyl-CoA dehydrogenase